MENSKRVKTGLINTFLVAAILVGASSCNNPSKSENNMDTVKSADTANNTQDAKFLGKASMINMEEIQLGQLARQNGAMSDVKDFGKMLEEDHTKSQSDLVSLARKKSITIPTTLDSNAQSDYKKLSAETGMDFDKDYCDMMISGHKDAIALFEKESTQANDSDIRQWAVSILPALHKHLDDAMTCREKCKKQ